jgi:hypothetical protein
MKRLHYSDPLTQKQSRSANMTPVFFVFGIAFEKRFSPQADGFADFISSLEFGAGRGHACACLRVGRRLCAHARCASTA